MSVTVLVATETHFVRDSAGQVYSTTGTDGYDFWTRYLDVFDRVKIAARTAPGSPRAAGVPVEGPGVEVSDLPEYRGPWVYLRSRAALGAAMRRALADADALCLRAPGPIAGLAWRLRGRRPFGVEVVGDPLDMSAGSVRSAARPIVRVALARDLRAMCRGADAVAYVTAEALQRRYPTRGWSTSYSSIHLDDEAFVDEEAVRQRYGAPALATRGRAGDPWRLVFVGSLAQLYKAPDVAIAALAACRRRGLHAVLTIVGDGKERAALERHTHACGVASRVRFLGHLPAGQPVRAVLDDADIFVLPSRQEGLPRAMIEAMARGVVSVGTRVGGIPELLPAARLAEPGDAGRLAEIITRLCESRAELVDGAMNDRRVALRYKSALLRPKRIACYERIRSALRCDSHERPGPLSRPCDSAVGRRFVSGPTWR
jgi:glycosyltransferase involved in cell wall biosynthesis